MTFTFSRRLALVFGVLLPIVETIRRWPQLGDVHMWPAWLDDFHFYYETNGMLRIAEFDGQNAQDITSVAPGFAAVLTPNERAVFSVTKNAQGSFGLQASGLVN